jgi:hypothetical protein
MKDRLRDLHRLAGSPTMDSLKRQAAIRGYEIGRSTLASVIGEGGSKPRWTTVEAFISACIRYAEEHRNPLPADKSSLMDWRAEYDRTVHWSPKVKSSVDAQILDYDVRRDGLFPLGTWSPARKLRSSRLLTEVVSAEDRPEQPYIDAQIFASAVDERKRNASGATVYLTDFRIDHQESDETQYCRIRQAPSIYPEVLAIEDLRIRRPELFVGCDVAVESNVRTYLATAVPSSLAVNLVVVSAENDELLCVERSAATDSAAGWWTVGVFETMKQADPNMPGATEDIFGLAIRGLNEELGLRPDDYHPIQVSWIGIYRPILRGHVVAVLKLRITRAEAHARARAAHSSYEHAAIDWIPLRKPMVRSFIDAPRSTYGDRVGSTLLVEDRTWTEHGRLAVLEAWRFRNALEG